VKRVPGGCVLIARKIISSSLWESSLATRVLAITCVLEANWKDGKTKDGTAIKRGQFMTSIRKLAFRSNLSVRKTRTALKDLEATQFLTVKATQLNTIVTINNYESYQNIDLYRDTVKIDLSDTSRDTVRDTPNDTNRIKDKNKTYIDQFEKFWKEYPRKIGKGVCLEIWSRLRPNNGLFEKITRAVENQKNSSQWKQSNGKFIPHPSTWLNQGRWDDELEPKWIDHSAGGTGQVVL